MLKFFWLLITRPKLVPGIIGRARFSACMQCENFKAGAFRNSCRVCKCTLSYGPSRVGKNWYPKEQCPIGIWLRVIQKED